jgi:hypothetical protein
VQQGPFSTPQVWQVLPLPLEAQARPPAVQTKLLPQQGSLSAPQAPPSPTQALPEQVPPPRAGGHVASWAMQFPFLQQPPPEQELSGQQVVTPQLVHVAGAGPACVQVVKG